MISLDTGIQITSVNTVLDARTKVSTLSNLTDGTIVNPCVGLIVWVDSESKPYIITGINKRQVTSYEILNSEDCFNYTSSTTYTDLSNNTKPVRKDGYVVEVDHDTSTSPYKYILQYIDGLGIHHKIIVSQNGGANTDIPNTIGEIYIYNGSYSGLYQAFQDDKVIIWHNNVATVEYQNNSIRLSTIDGDGVLHTLIISSGNEQLPTEGTKHFIKKEDYFYFDNYTTFSELKNRGQVPVKIGEYVAKVTDLGTSIKMEYLDGHILNVVTKSNDESISRNQIDILLSVEVDSNDHNFDIKNSQGISVGSINFGSNSTTGIAELTFTDGMNTFSAPLPSIRYDSNTQLLKYTTDGGESWQDIIKMSNLQIKEVTEKELDDHLTEDLAFNTQTVDNKTYYIEQGADSTYALGDLILASDDSTDYTLWVCDQCDFDPSDETYTYHFVNVGSINNVSLVADQVEFDNSTNGFEATDVQGAIEELGKYAENSEWAYIVTDKRGGILYGFKKDGSPYFGYGCPQQVIDYVSSHFTNTDALTSLLNLKVDKETGKSLVNDDVVNSIGFIPESQWLQAITDSNGRIPFGIRPNGKIFIYDLDGFPKNIKDALDALAEQMTHVHKKIKLLVFGNSLSMDAISYVPWMLHKICPNLEFVIYNYYVPGGTLAQQLRLLNGETIENKTINLYYADNTNYEWTVVFRGSTMNASLNALLAQGFDHITLQEFTNNVSTFDSTNYLELIQKLQEICGSAKFHHLLDKTTTGNTSLPNRAKQYAQTAYQTMPVSTIVNPGMAFTNAYNDSVLGPIIANNLPINAEQTVDNTHAAEGLPCYIEALIMTQWVLRLLGDQTSIMTDDLLLDATEYQTIGVQGGNYAKDGNNQQIVIYGTNEQQRLAQRIAVQTYKQSFDLETMNINNN